MKTIPIAIRNYAFKELEEFGFPIVIVNSFEELNLTRLNFEWDRLSSKLDKASNFFKTDTYFNLLIESNNPKQACLEYFNSKKTNIS